MINKLLTKITLAEIESLKIKHPSILSAIITGKRFGVQSKAGTLNAVTNFIELEGGYIEKIKPNNIWVLIKGQILRVKMVSFRYIPSNQDAEYCNQLEAAGGHYLIVLNFQTFYDWYVKQFECGQEDTQ